MTGKRHETSAGGIVTRESPDGIQTLLVRNPRGAWSFPKGHVERGEAWEQAAEREVLEESGVHASVVARAGHTDYYFHARGTLILKTVHWYLMRWIAGEPRPDNYETVEARFFPEAEVPAALSYPNDEKVWRIATSLLRNPTGSPAPRPEDEDAI